MYIVAAEIKSPQSKSITETLFLIVYLYNLEDEVTKTTCNFGFSREHTLLPA